MNDITMEINGTKVQTVEGKTVLQVAKTAGIYIPTLCNNENLAPYGGCRLCLVEIIRNDRTRLVASCVYPAEEGLIIKTESEKLSKIRRMLLELIIPLSPTGPVLTLAEKYGLKDSRFTATESKCILCGLCVRYCADVKKANAIGFVNRGIEREVVFLPEVASRVCGGCRECLSLCPSGKLVAASDGARFAALAWEREPKKRVS